MAERIVHQMKREGERRAGGAENRERLVGWGVGRLAKAVEITSFSKALVAERSSKEGPTPAGRPDRRRVVKTAVMICAGILCVATAFVLYPPRASVYRPAGLGFDFTVPAQRGYAAIEVTPTQRTNTYKMTLFVEYGAKRPSPATVMLTFPPGSTAVRCTQNGGQDQCNYIPAPSDSSGAKTYLAVAHPRFVGGAWTARLVFTIRSQVPPWEANGVTAEAELPTVQGETVRAGSPFSPPLNGRESEVNVTYDVRNAASYDWTGGPEPYLTSSRSVTWMEPLEDFSQPVAVTGTNSSQTDEDATRTFLARALLGIAGGAFIAALQELLDRWADRKRTMNV